MKLSTPLVYGYYRRSRPGSSASETSAKLEDGKAICLRLAQQHGLPLAEENVFTEQESGTQLETREELVKLLRLATAGKLTHLVTPYQDRLSRGNKRDEAEIEDALCAGGVILVTTEGLISFGDDYDTRDALLFGIKSAVARHYVADLVKKRKEADLTRLKRNERSRSYAPYGYKHLRAVKDAQGALVSPKGVEVIPAEYAVLEEIFRRVLLGESLRSIATDLTARKVAPPSIGRKVLASVPTVWYAPVLRKLLLNPFYAGRLAQRGRVLRNRKRQTFAPDDYILSDEEGDWQHPVSLEDWYAVLHGLRERRTGTARGVYLATGLLFCSQGARMCGTGGQSEYMCFCQQRGMPHPRGRVAAGRVDSWLKGIVSAAVAALPESFFATDMPPAPDRGQLQAAFHQAQRDVSSGQATVQDMMLRRNWYETTFGRENYETAAGKAAAALEEAKGRLEATYTALAAPDMREAQSLLQEIRGSMGNFWLQASAEEQRALVRLLVQRVELTPPAPGTYYTRAASVTFWGWAQAFAPGIPLLPYRAKAV